MLKDILVLDTSNQIKKIEKFFKSNNFKNYDLTFDFDAIFSMMNYKDYKTIIVNPLGIAYNCLAAESPVDFALEIVKELNKIKLPNTKLICRTLSKYVDLKFEELLKSNLPQISSVSVGIEKFLML
ncbi:MAG: hypothetical protein HRU03_07495 [Nanoarchaeales archaeon]|nr:hypothetical protein [Nanoarchaeales archaeon]